MTKVSKRLLNKTLENYIFELFVKTISDLKNADDTKIFIDDLLSPTEKTMLVKRLAIAVLLSKGKTYDDIDDILKVSRATIMKVSYWLKHGNSGYQKAVKKIIDKEKKEAFIDKIDELFLQLSPPKAYESPAYLKKKEQGKKLYLRKRKREMLG